MLIACGKTSAVTSVTQTERSTAAVTAKVPQSAFISEQTAIDIATKQASIGNGHVSGATEPPKNIQATLAPLATARVQLASKGWTDILPDSSDMMVWFITMDGSWILAGGPLPPLTPMPTISPPHFTDFLVIIDAQTGKVLLTTAH